MTLLKLSCIDRNWERSKSLYVADSKEVVCAGIPHPGCFARRVWIYLIMKELTFLGTTKGPQELEIKKVASGPSRRALWVNEGRAMTGERAERRYPPERVKTR